eukprot:CAMPEP_0185847232 /NCGR_PEP_ID=MMETSP1354-20130828/2585_1 /TAXON_ID=708628 /ORGANISM="Erythrolobus madagascarensis, Strain CCMP3276" /LENGTH=742 /DNA_ID=CAMNT_0028547499 /DNA_START=591 /DNA_END=2819 /DNA_ORIENTATION=+
METGAAPVAQQVLCQHSHSSKDDIETDLVEGIASCMQIARDNSNASSAQSSTQKQTSVLIRRIPRQGFGELRELVSSLSGNFVQGTSEMRAPEALGNPQKAEHTPIAISRISSEVSPGPEPSEQSSSEESVAKDENINSLGGGNVTEHYQNAVVVFSDEKRAADALTFLNGYVLKCDGEHRIEAQSVSDQQPSDVIPREASDLNTETEFELGHKKPSSEQLGAEEKLPESKVPEHTRADEGRGNDGGYRGRPYAQTKLFVGQLPSHVDEEALISFFAPFGEIVRCHILRQGDVSRGCGFVQYATRAQAEHALAVMNGVCVFDSRRALNVRFAESSAQKNLRLQQQQNPSNAGIRVGNGGQNFRRHSLSAIDSGSDVSSVPSPMLHPRRSQPMQFYSSGYSLTPHMQAHHQSPPQAHPHPQQAPYFLTTQPSVGHTEQLRPQPFMYTAYGAPYVMGPPQMQTPVHSQPSSAAMYSVTPEHFGMYYYYDGASTLDRYGSVDSCSTGVSPSVGYDVVPNVHAVAGSTEADSGVPPESPVLGSAPAPLPPTSPMEHVAHGVAAQCLYSPAHFYPVQASSAHQQPLSPSSRSASDQQQSAGAAAAALAYHHHHHHHHPTSPYFAAVPVSPAMYSAATPHLHGSAAASSNEGPSSFPSVDSQQLRDRIATGSPSTSAARRLNMIGQPPYLELGPSATATSAITPSNDVDKSSGQDGLSTGVIANSHIQHEDSEGVEHDTIASAAGDSI